MESNKIEFNKSKRSNQYAPGGGAQVVGHACRNKMKWNKIEITKSK